MFSQKIGRVILSSLISLVGVSLMVTPGFAAESIRTHTHRELLGKRVEKTLLSAEKDVAARCDDEEFQTVDRLTATGGKARHGRVLSTRKLFQRMFKNG
ncbi:MAG: hypothetical protein KDD60_05745 [Bdellovibrionales bacterium]|nr:hypothetical protein [Bdellovibrionales bacterium]